MIILGIDPGYEGAFVFFDIYQKGIKVVEMPIIKHGKEKEIDFHTVQLILDSVPYTHAFLERAIPFAMGSKGAFNYGRGYMALELALKFTLKPVTYTEPAKWTKVMHEGISSDLKPKAKSDIAVRRLYPDFIKYIPANKNGKLHEGAVDALLIAGYGRRQL